MNEVNGLGLFDFCFDFYRNESFFLLLFFTFSILQSCSLYLNSTQLISFHFISLPLFSPTNNPNKQQQQQQQHHLPFLTPSPASASARNAASADNDCSASPPIATASDRTRTPHPTPTLDSAGTASPAAPPSCRSASPCTDTARRPA